MIPQRVLDNADRHAKGEPIDWQVGDWAVYSAGQDGNGYLVVTEVKADSVVGHDTFAGAGHELPKANIWPASHNKLGLDYVVGDFLAVAEKIHASSTRSEK